MVAAAVPVHRCVQILQVPNHSTKDFAPDHPTLAELFLQHRTLDFDWSGDIMIDPKPAHRMRQIYSPSFFPPPCVFLTVLLPLQLNT